MSSTFPLLLLLLVLAAAMLFFLVQAEGGWGRIYERLERMGIENNFQHSIPNSQESDSAHPTITDYAKRPESEPVRVPVDFYSGDSRFSQGKCQRDTDCIAGGCSGEACMPVSKASDFVSICDYSDDFPNVQGLNCGCVEGVCGWR